MMNILLMYVCLKDITRLAFYFERGKKQMSMPNIPDISPTISIDRNDVINLLLASIALEEIGLAHIINAEGEKIQYALGTLDGSSPSPQPSLEDILDVNSSVNDTLAMAIKKELLLDIKLKQVLDLIKIS